MTWCCHIPAREQHGTKQTFQNMVIKEKAKQTTKVKKSKINNTKLCALVGSVESRSRLTSVLMTALTRKRAVHLAWHGHNRLTRHKRTRERRPRDHARLDIKLFVAIAVARSRWGRCSSLAAAAMFEVFLESLLWDVRVTLPLLWRWRRGGRHDAVLLQRQLRRRRGVRSGELWRVCTVDWRPGRFATRNYVVRCVVDRRLLRCSGRHDRRIWYELGTVSGDLCLVGELGCLVTALGVWREGWWRRCVRPLQCAWVSPDCSAGLWARHLVQYGCAAQALDVEWLGLASTAHDAESLVVGVGMTGHRSSLRCGHLTGLFVERPAAGVIFVEYFLELHEELMLLFLQLFELFLRLRHLIFNLFQRHGILLALQFLLPTQPLYRFVGLLFLFFPFSLAHDVILQGRPHL